MIEGKIRSTTKTGLDKSSPYKYSICHIYSVFSAIHLNFLLFSSFRYLDSYSIVYYFKESIKRKKRYSMSKIEEKSRLIGCVNKGDTKWERKYSYFY